MLELIIYAIVGITCYGLGFGTAALLCAAKLGDQDTPAVVIGEIPPEYKLCKHQWGAVMVQGGKYVKACSRCGEKEIFS